MHPRYIITVNENEIRATENPNQTMRIGGLYAKHRCPYLAGRMIIYQ